MIEEPMKHEHIGLNPFAPASKVAEQVSDPLYRRDREDDWLIEFAKTLGRQSRERWELRRKLRPAPISDEQYDNAIEREEMGKRYL
jgi:SOS response regulatory protein OraA/RecX